jgi:hypothetical protein
LSFSCCAGDRCDITGSDKDCDRSRRPDAEDRGWSNTSRVHGDQMIERLGDAVCGLHRDKEMSILRFLIWPQNQGCHFLPVWLQNWWLQVSQVGSQNRQLQFSYLGLKITTTVSWFVAQN